MSPGVVGAGDFSDVVYAPGRGLTSSYLNSYYSAMGASLPAFWAVHAYQTVVRSKYARLQRFLDWGPVKRTGATWITETGVYRYRRTGATISEADAAAQLQSFFNSDVYTRPTYRTFVRDGHKVLYGAVNDSGGPERWAVELGVPYIPHRSGAGLTHDETHAVLRQLLREHHPGRFPTQAWLKRHGPPGLAAAVTRAGGAAHWAAVLHMPPPPPARWTDELIEAELRRICRDATCWPSRADFEAAGATGLLRAVYAGRGSRWWAQRLGLPTDGLRARRRQHFGLPPSPSRR